MDGLINQVHEACLNMGLRLDTLSTDMQTNLEARESEREVELKRQLGAKDDIIEERDRGLQLLTEQHDDKVRSFTEFVRNHIEEALGNLKRHQQEERERTSSNFEQKIRESIEANKELQTQLNEAKAMLSSNPFPADEEIADQLREEQRTSSALREQIQQLETQSTFSRELESKWQANIDTIDSLRTKVTSASHHLQRVEGMAAKTDYISRTNAFINSTAQFLAHQRVWVDQELEEIAGTKTCIADTESHQPGSPAADLEGNRNDFTNLGHWSREGPSDRKVHVRSPEDFGSPSPPPSVAQEQKRRRRGDRPRTIMRYPIGESFIKYPENSQAIQENQEHQEEMIRRIRAGFILDE